MDWKYSVFTKTAKGMAELNNRATKLSRDALRVLSVVDGKSNGSALVERAGFTETKVGEALAHLINESCIKVFSTGVPAEAPPRLKPGGVEVKELDLDFTTLLGKQELETRAEAAARARVEAEHRAKA